MKKLNLSVLLFLSAQFLFAQKTINHSYGNTIVPQSIKGKQVNNLQGSNNVVLTNAVNLNLVFDSELWSKKSESSISLVGNRQIIPNKYQTVSLVINDLKSELSNAVLRTVTNQGQGIVIELPDPDGGTSKYRVYKNTTMSPGLEVKYPEIRTYDAVSIDYPGEFAKIDVTPHGFHAMVFSVTRKTFFIDPYSKGDMSNYIVYYKKDFVTTKTMQCGVDDAAKSLMNDLNPNNQKIIGTCDLRTYRLALAATGEYTAFHGGTVALGLAAQVVSMNRVNGVFERDCQITMTMIPNNNLLVYTNGGTDPYTNNNGFTMLNENQTNINAVIGAGNYDIGHVFSTGGGGVAQLQSPCGANKARGVTGSGSPINDPFDIDYVAHEMGHQWGGNHTQNNNCQRNGATAVEPGSASTIMGYAGICVPNVQNNSDDHFHGISIQEMSNFISGFGGSCAVLTPVVNVGPTITGTNGNVTIPANTPFALTAIATDPNAANVLSYCWEQMDNQVSTQPPVATSTGGPNFRSNSPNVDPTRYFPSLASLMSGGPFTWEVLSSVNRTMNFRVTVRDNAGPLPEVGCVENEDVTITVDASTGPFVVTYPSATGITWTGATSETVTWNVAGTTGGGVNCPNVDIYLSTDGGVTFPTLLAAGVPNDGSQPITVPNTPTSTAVIMVICSNGTFFDISDNVFTIIASTFDYTLSSTPTSVSVCPPADAVYTINIGSIGGYSDPVTLTATGVPAGATATFGTNPVFPVGTSTLTISGTGAVIPGSYAITISGASTSGPKSIIITLVVSDPAPTAVTLTTPANLATGVLMPVSLTWTAAAGAGVVYDIDIATDVAFAAIVDNAVGLATNSYISTVLSPTTLYYWRVRAYNGCGTASFSSTFEFTTGIPAGCDTLNFPPPGTLAIYTINGDWAFGWNATDQHLSKAEYFSAASHVPYTDVTGGIYYLWSAADGGNGATVDFNVWDATGGGGSPGTILGTTTITLATLNSNPAGIENTLIEILYNSPVNVGAADYYFGFTMNGFGAGDSLGIVSNTIGDIIPGTAWNQLPSSVWEPVTTTYGVDIVQFMSPYMTDVPPAAVIVTNTITICEGDSISYDGTTSVNTSAYNWVFPSGLPATSTTPTQNVTYPTAGNFTGYLVAGGACQSQSVDSIAITVNSLPTIAANATSTTVCTGGSVTLTGSGATSYTWDNGVTDGLAFNPIITTLYTVTGTDGNGCESTDTITIFVNPLPTVVANATSILVCSGSPVTLTGSGAASYTWDNGVTDGLAFNPTATILYTVTGTDGNGCQNTDAITVTVNALPAVVANATSVSICSGDPVTLTGSGATSYTWDNGVTDGLAFNPAVTTLYTVTGTDGNGCQNTDAITVTVNTLPTVVANATSTSICIGDPVTLSGSGATSYTWDNGVTDGLAFNPIATTLYTVTGTDGNGCQNTDAITVTVNSLPTVVANATSTSICNGDPVTLTGSGATSYTWDNGVTNGLAFNPAVTTLYTVTGTDGNGCQNTDAITVVVSACGVPPVASFSSSDSTLCLGDCISFNDLSTAVPTAWTWYFFGAATTTSNSQNPTNICYNGAGTFDVALVVTNAAGQDSLFMPAFITVNTLPTVVANATSILVCSGSPVTLTGSGATSYTWDNGVTDGLAFNPTATTLYTVTGTDGNGCVNTDAITVTVNPLPTVVANTTSTSICNGDPVTLTGSGATSYTWNNGVTDGLAFNPIITTLYTVTGTDGNGCINTDAITVTVNPLPTVVANATSILVCSGSPVTLTGSGATSYTWDNGVTDGLAFNPIATTLYTVTGTDGNGCINTDAITVTINALPTVVANATSILVCSGSPVTLTGSGATSYTWDNGVTDGLVFNPTATTLYTVTGTDGNGCQNTDAITVTINPLPTVVANATSTSICTGGSVTLTGSGATSYTWNNGVTDGLAFNPAVTTLYTVTGTDGNGCTNTDAITVTVNPLPTVVANATSTSICTGGSVTLSGSGATSYTWDNGVTDGLAFNPAVTTFYTVTGTDGNGCINADTVTVFVVNCAFPPTSSFSSTDSTLCIGDCIDFIDLSSGSPTGWTWYFFGAVTTTSINQNPTNICYNAAGTFDVALVTTNAGGQDSLFIAGSITVNQDPIVLANATSNAICDGDVLTLTGSGATSYTWDNGVIDGVTFNPTMTTNYTVTGTDGNGCTNTDAITVTVNPLPTVVASNDTSICATEDAFLTANGASSYSWDNGLGIGQSQTVSPLSTTTYTVTGDDVNGCTSTDVVVVTIDNSTCFNIPNVFSPNGDGKNDTWILRGIEQFPEVTVKIFNRWGGEMFSSNGYTEPWDGTFNGANSASATYYYIIDLGDGQDPVNGTVNIIR